MLWFQPVENTKKVNEVIAKYVDTCAINLNKLIDGSSVNCPTASNAIAIQDLVKRLNGSGLKSTIFSSSIKIYGRYIKIYLNPSYKLLWYFDPRPKQPCI